MNEIHFHRRNLPHFYRVNSTYFITYRLKGTIPIKVLEELKSKYSQEKVPTTKEEKYRLDKLYFSEYDKYLDSNRDINWLTNKDITEIVQTSLHFYNKKDYDLICYTIMPNHVHLVFHLLENARPIDKIMHSIKRFSARESNKLLNREGSFWQSESYDHIVRDEDELERIIKYVLLIPVKAKLVERWEDSEYSYLAKSW
ncbi:MAG: transposase [Melioribacteraceae bacterium]